MEDMLIHRISDNDLNAHHQGTLCRELWNLRTEGTMCDFILDVNGEYLLGHRVILSACSPYLKSCCLNPQAISQDGVVQIKVQDYSFKVCLKLFEFLYTGRPVDFAGPALDEFKRLCEEWHVVGSTNIVERENGCSESRAQDDSQMEKGKSRLCKSTLLDKYQVVCKESSTAETNDSEYQPKTENTLASEYLDGTDHNDLLEPPIKGSAKRGRPRKSASKTRKRPRSDDLKPSGKERSIVVRGGGYKVCKNKSEQPHLTLEQNTMPTELQPLYDSDTDVEDGPASAISPENVPSESQTTDLMVDNAEETANNSMANSQTETSLRRTRRKRAAQENPTVSAGDEVLEIENPNAADNTESKTQLKKTRRKRAACTLPEVEINDLGMVICPVCDADFESRAKLQYHRKSVHKNKRQGWCKICKTKFADRNQLKAHNVENHWKEGMELPTQYICEAKDCNYQTYNRKSYNAHKSFVHQSERSICDLCGKSLKSEASLKQHKLLVHVIALSKDYPCTSCDKIFKSYCGLTRHQVNIHEGGGKRDKLICPHCGKTCLNTGTMSEHLYKKHDVPPPPGKTGYKCKHCDFKTIKLREIKNHELRHIPEKQFSCDLCGKSYPTGRELGRHKLLHTDRCKIWKCTHCPYTTKYGTAALRSHVQVKHEESRPWVCTICSYRTKLKGNLHKHIRNVHKCQVKTNWTIPKLAEGASCDRYLVPKSSSLKNPPIMKTESAGEAEDIDKQNPTTAAVTANLIPSEAFVSQDQNYAMYDAGLAKPILTPSVQVGMPHGDSFLQKPQPSQLDILSQLTTVAPNLGNIHGDHIIYNSMGMYPGTDPKLN